MKGSSTRHLIRDVIRTSMNFQDSYDFAKEHKLWEGLMKYKWLSKACVIIAILLSIKLFSVCIDWWQSASVDSLSIANIGGLIGGLFKGGYDLFVIGGLKYVILILAEVIIFHFARKTMEIVTGDEVDSSFAAFMEAQKRMVRVAVFSFIMESFFSVLFNIGIGILGAEFIRPMGIFLIQCFFLGYAIIDYYNEIFHMTVKQSVKYTQQYAGVALAIGIPVYLIMLMPLIGTVMGPVLGAIVATITMNELLEEDHNMEWVFLEEESKE